MITFDSSWVNLMSSCRWLPDLKHCVPFLSTCSTSTCCFVNFACCWHCSSLFTGSRIPVPGCFCFTGSRVPSLAVSLSSRPFGTCFNQPATHPLGLKASVVHDHCRRRYCGHRMSNLLKILDVKGSQYVTMCILPSSTSCTSSNGSPSSKRLAKQPGSSPTFALEHSCARASPRSRICCTIFHSDSLNSFLDSKHQYQLLLQNRGNHDFDVTRFRNTHKPLIK